MTLMKKILNMAAVDNNEGNAYEEKRRLTVVERYYKPYYKLDSKGSEDVCILAHSNRLCIVTVAPSHPIIAEQKEVLSVDFKLEGANRLDNKVSGKGKKGAQWLKHNSPMCKVTCTDGMDYIIPCGIRSQLIEINTNLIDAPTLLTQKPQTEGYIAIVLPKLKEYDFVMKTLTTEDDYRAKREEKFKP